jgi:hypothetical protein
MQYHDDGFLQGTPLELLYEITKMEMLPGNESEPAIKDAVLKMQALAKDIIKRRNQRIYKQVNKTIESWPDWKKEAMGLFLDKHK